MRFLLVLFFSLAIVNAQLPAYLFRPLQIQSYLSEIHPQIKYLNAFGDYSVDSIRSQPTDILLASRIPTAFSDSVSERCHNDSVLYAHSIYRSTELWAIQMLDSTGKHQDGLLRGNGHVMGHFDQCLDVKIPAFQGQYCTVFWLPYLHNEADAIRDRSVTTILSILGLLTNQTTQPLYLEPNPYTYMLPSQAFCLPSTCNSEDLKLAFADLVGSHLLANYSIVTVTNSDYCFTQETISSAPAFDTSDITVIVLLSSIGLVVTVSTACHWRLQQKATEIKSKSLHILLSFSLLINVRKLLSTKKAPDSIPCLHGIRVLSTTWIVLAHTYSQVKSQFNQNIVGMKEDALSIAMQVIANSSVAVDTFLVLSGLLVSYTILKNLNNTGGRLNPITIYLNRYLRLTFVYGFVIAFVATLIVYVGSGPNWYLVIANAEACRSVWWHHILYINNIIFRDISETCMPETWYLATDMQLFLFSPLLIYLIWRWRKVGVACLAIGLFACTAGNAAAYIILDLPFTVRVFHESGDSTSYWENYYQDPWFRAQPYLIGISLGCILRHYRPNEIKLSKVKVVVAWLLSMLVGFSVIYGLTPYLDDEREEIDSWIVCIYGSLHRLAWSLCVGWVIFACFYGYGGPINHLLSWKIFIPFGRLSYCTFLIHYNWMNIYYATMKSPFYYTRLDTFYEYLGHLCVSLGFAFVLSLTIEAPFMNLTKLILQGKPNQSTQNPTDTDVGKF